MQKKIVLLLNLGTPSNPDPKSIKSYLTEFLLDPRVLDINPLMRQFLVRCVIAPKRSKSLAPIYESIWMDQGSPLLSHTINVQKALQKRLGEGYVVESAMRYGLPSLSHSLDRLKNQPIQELLLLPLFPQYASATTGSVLEKTLEHIAKWSTIPSIRIVSEFCDRPDFIRCHSQKLKAIGSYEKLIISFHSLPERQIKKISSHCLSSPDCCKQKRMCYRSHCQRTYEALIKECGLKNEDTIMTFQSRLGNEPWLGPETEQVAKDLARSGIRKIAIMSLSFTIDCIETLYELKHDVRNAFIESGGEECLVAPSLNDSPDFIEVLVGMVKNE